MTVLKKSRPLLLLWIAVSCMISSDGVDAANAMEFQNVVIKPDASSLKLEFDYRRLSGERIEDATFYVGGTGGTRLCLSSEATSNLPEKLMKAEAGHVSLSIPTPYLPAGDHTLALKYAVRTGEGDRCLKSGRGRSIIRIAGSELENCELRCKIAGDTAPLIRGRGVPTQYTGTWRFYFTPGPMYPDLYISKFKDGKWGRIGASVPLKPASKDGWRDFSMKCRGGVVEVELDGQKISCEDADSSFSNGYAGFRSADHGVAYVDDVSLTDLDSGKVVFSDDFNRPEIGGKWIGMVGSWEISDGLPVVQEARFGSFKTPERGASTLPVVELKRRGDGIDMLVDGKPVVPLLLSVAATGAGSAYEKSSYDVLRHAYSAGVRMFAPLITDNNFDKTGHMDFSILDDVMAQSLAACPEGRFLLRMAIPPPPWLPASDRMKMLACPDGAVVAGGFEDTKVEPGFDASLASVKYKEYFAEEAKRLFAHMKSQAYGASVIGLLVTGGGYELNWGQSVTFPTYLIDGSKAQVDKVRAGLKAKYGDVDALKRAWDSKGANFDGGLLPGLVERTDSDIAGFRNPASGKSRRVLDFLDIYGAETDESLIAAFDAVNAAAPTSFSGAFYGCALNSEHRIAGAGFGGERTYPLLNHPGMKFAVGIVSYADRKAGGVSVSTAPAWESVRMHGKLSLNENDLRTPGVGDSITEEDYPDAVQTMRREFANTVIMERNAMWYFDMGFTGPWFDHPALLEEMSKELKIGKVALEPARKSASEILVVVDTNAWRYYSQTTGKLAKGERIGYNSVAYPKTFNTLAFEAMMRMGAPKDIVHLQDFQSKGGYKLYIFPTAFRCDEAFKRRVEELAEGGAVCVFMGPAGLIDDKEASLNNMERLLGMKISFDGPMPLTASMVPSSHPIASGFAGGEPVGAGACVRRYESDCVPTWYRFYVDGHDEKTGILACYDTPARKPAIAVRRVGKGAVIYSGVPITQPRLYRNIAKFAGVHIYLDTDDALYADGDFLMVHTKDAGLKKLNLRGKALEVTELFSGDVAGRDCDRFETTLPAKKTVIYYIGGDRTFLKRLKEARRN